MIRRNLLLIVLVIATIALPLQAQTGCVDSPESPTLVLALVGGLGLIAATLRTSRRTKE
jgi:XrtJ-associated TM-motif-TM protein